MRPDGADVHWDNPVPAGGRQPYSVQCDPGSGSSFAIGESPVRCVATDADMAQAACTFLVTVRVSQTLTKTRFLAFGDSITEGKISLAPVRFLDEVDTYPYQLRQMLLQRYPTQSFVVTNSGRGAERTNQGVLRLPVVLDAERPEVVLLLEGVNAVWLLSTRVQAESIREMIRAAQARGVDVIVATVMPVSAEWENDNHRGAMARITALNDEIKQIAAVFGVAPVVDLFALFTANTHLLGADGIHPTAEGQARIADAFGQEIVRRYETRATMTPRLQGFSTRDLREPAAKRMH